MLNPIKLIKFIKRRCSFKICFTAVAALFCFQELMRWNRTGNFSINVSILKTGVNTKIFNEDTTVVLMWTKFYSNSDESTLTSIRYGVAWRPGCCKGVPVCCTGPDILVTTNRNLLPNATAVVFYHYFGNLNSSDLPTTRYPGQVWVLFSKEGPRYSPGLTKYANLFNWTMGYRSDSDIWAPYGYKVPLDKPLSKNEPIIMPGGTSLEQWIAGKSKAVASVISNCNSPSKRENLRRALVNSTLSTDFYGGCGKLKLCSRTKLSCNLTEVWQKISETYGFYFAAENTLCTDYITEKFWRTLQVGMVPLVYGGANYSAVAPPNSFVDASQFQSVSELVAYLTRVGKDPVEYAKFFEWRRDYEIKLTDCWHGWCTLCERAKEFRKNPDTFPVNVYKDLHGWWSKRKVGNKLENMCINLPAIVKDLK